MDGWYFIELETFHVTRNVIRNVNYLVDKLIY